MGHSLGITYHGITHITPDTTASVYKILSKVNELALHVTTPNREGSNTTKLVIDALALGEQKLKSSTLTTFNKKIWSMLVGEWFETEVDDIPEVAFDLSLELDGRNK